MPMNRTLIASEVKVLEYISLFCQLPWIAIVMFWKVSQKRTIQLMYIWRDTVILYRTASVDFVVNKIYCYFFPNSNCRIVLMHHPMLFKKRLFFTSLAKHIIWGNHLENVAFSSFSKLFSGQDFPTPRSSGYVSHSLCGQFVWCLDRNALPGTRSNDLPHRCRNLRTYLLWKMVFMLDS
jgi:hypothetical protein